jgi:hypothetical protein
MKLAQSGGYVSGSSLLKPDRTNLAEEELIAKAKVMFDEIDEHSTGVLDK